MTLPLAISVAVLFAAGAFMLMRRSFVKIVIGLAMLGHAANLLIFTSGTPVEGKPPLVPREYPVDDAGQVLLNEDGEPYEQIVVREVEVDEAGLETVTYRAGTVSDRDFTDPLPPALILTAIVIGFGIVSYTIVLLKRTYRDMGTDDLEEMTLTDR